MWGNHDASEAAECNFFESLRFSEVKVIAPACVAVGKAVSPACEPGDSAGPRAARSPASNTVVVAPPGAGITMLPGKLLVASATISVADARSPSPSLIV